MRTPTFFLAAALAVVTLPAVAHADALACTDAYEKAQEAKAVGHLNATLVQLRVCVDSSCPKFIRDDCMRWLDQTEAALPTVVFAVLRDGKDQVQAEVRCDGELIAESLDGKAIPVDPGYHQFLISIPGSPAIERRLLIREGERNRIVDAEFKSASAIEAGETSSVASARGTADRRAYWTYGLAGAGVAGLAGFTVLALAGSSQQHDLEQSCSPYCQPSQVDSVKTKYLLADTFLGVGLVSLGVATYLYVTRHAATEGRHGQAHVTSVGLAPQSAGTGATLQISTVF